MTEPLAGLIERVASEADALLAEALGVATIAAPPFGEATRSAHIASRFRAAGLEEVTVDALGSVTGRRPGKGPRVLVVSHMDTVFPAETPLVPRREGDRVYCPGIRDNSTAVANLISLARLLEQTGAELPCDLILASSVGEEGLGDLRGMRKLIEDWGDKVDAVIAYDGELGNLVHGGAGSQRYTITYHAQGGHSFEAFGNPSAVHGLVAACERFCRIPIPSDPKTTLNIGTISGGVSVNAIAEEATAVIDMRSVSQGELEKLAAAALKIFEETAKEFDCTADIKKVGDRPGGNQSLDHPLCRAALSVLGEMQVIPRISISSTDANISFARGIASVCIGSSNGGNTHTVNEYLLVPSVVPGLQQLIRLLAKFGEDDLKTIGATH